MINRFQSIATISLLIASNVALAGTIIKSQSDNEITTVLTDGKRARMQTNRDEYVILDYAKHTFKIINTKDKQVVLLNTNKKPTAKAMPKLQTAIKHLGAGIEVAGYPTQKYSYSVNGKTCGIVFASKEVYQKEGIKELFQAIRAMMEKQQALLGSLASAGMMNDCDMADIDVTDHISKVGVPLRTEKNGRLDSEVISIKSGVAVPANSFDIPASYKVVTMQDKMDAGMRDMQQMQIQQLQQMQSQTGAMQPQIEEMPTQMQQMMQQMQQSGQLTPEMMQQMREAEKMMQQYQQPGN